MPVASGNAVTALRFEYIDHEAWKLTRNFAWRFRDGIVVVVPEGFVSDKHSVPRPLWSLVPPDQYARAAIYHDWAYYRNGIVKVYRDGDRPEIQSHSRKECDERYREMLADRGAGWTRRNVMYAGVRLWGWNAWRKHRKANEKGLRPR